VISLLGFLQKSSINLSEVIPASCSEGYPTTSDDGIEVIRIKVEEGADVHKKVDPVAITFTAVKSEQEVSSVTVCPLWDSLHHYP
jgi:hypothetical protein